jgi:hypothetical protein
MVRSRLAPLVLAVAAIASAAAVAAARDPGSQPPPAVADDGPRNPAAEAATGDPDAMRAVVQGVVDCLRAKGWHPGDPQVQGANVVIADWEPAWGSAAWRADEECAFSAR